MPAPVTITTRSAFESHEAIVDIGLLIADSLAEQNT